MELWHIKAKSWVQTTFSRTLVKNGSLEIDLKLLRTVGSGLGFFKRGWQWPLESELLIINKIPGLTVSQTLSGIESRLHIVDFMCKMISDKHDNETGS